MGYATVRRSILLAFAASAAGVVLSCAPKTKRYATECKADGQERTFIGRFLLPPIPLAIDEAFSGDEALAIQRAAFSWNDFFATVHGGPIFDIGQLGSPRRGIPPLYSPAGIGCGNITGFFNGSWGDRVLFAAKRSAITGGTGALSSSNQVLALTTSCKTTPVGSIDSLTGAIVEFNFTFFNQPSLRIFDLETIALHEFGHLLGLDHSFASAASTGVPGPDSPAAITGAVMRPVFDFPDGVNSVQVRSTRANDQERANCLYEEVGF